MSATAPLSDDDIKTVADLLKLLSHPTRLRLALHLTGGEASVAEMERDLAIRQPSLSQQLGELREAGIVSTRREHKLVFYALIDPRTTNLLSMLPAIVLGKGAERRTDRKATSPEHRFGGAAVFAVAGDPS